MHTWVACACLVQGVKNSEKPPWLNDGSAATMFLCSVL
jgi:hypothetical protein